MGSLGWPEILMILVIALIVFGPRKLPELGKTIGNSLAQFRRASEDFKRTWEEEVDMEKHRGEITSASGYEPYEGAYSQTYSEPGENYSMPGYDSAAPSDGEGQPEAAPPSDDANSPAPVSATSSASSLEPSIDETKQETT